MKKLNPYVYLFTMGHFAVDWAQGAIPALLPYFIATYNLNYQDAATLIFANMLHFCQYAIVVRLAAHFRLLFRQDIQTVVHSARPAALRYLHYTTRLHG